MSLFKPSHPGPSAALEAQLRKKYYGTLDPVESEAILKQMAELRRRAWQKDVPPEDAEWARHHREMHERTQEPHRRLFAGRWSHDGYLVSTGVVFDPQASPWENLDKSEKEPWRDFGNRVRKAPADEPEHETIAAALEAYAKASGRPAPAPSEHWFAAARYMREMFKKYPL
jgi:hypothetical protein